MSNEEFTQLSRQPLYPLNYLLKSDNQYIKSFMYSLMVGIKFICEQYLLFVNNILQLENLSIHLAFI